MVVLCDTSVLVPGILEHHVHHVRTFPLIQKILTGKIEGVAAAHSIAESYASLTRIGNEPPVSPPQARQLIRDNILAVFKIVDLDQQDYLRAIDLVSEKNLRSGVIYDALILQAARKRKITRLVTWNLKHFERLSQGEIQIRSPDSFS